MCAATSQMVAKVAELMELRKMIEDLTAEADLIAKNADLTDALVSIDEAQRQALIDAMKGA